MSGPREATDTSSTSLRSDNVPADWLLSDDGHRLTHSLGIRIVRGADQLVGIGGGAIHVTGQPAYRF